MTSIQMTRQPHNVLVFPFRRDVESALFLLLRRSDDGVWQGVCGGVEGEESTRDAAVRELREEVGTTQDPPLSPLSMVGGAPRSVFGGDAYWPDHVYIVEKHYFGADFSGLGDEVHLSREHTHFEWLGYEAAYERLEYCDERTALWELNERIQKSDLRLD